MRPTGARSKANVMAVMADHALVYRRRPSDRARSGSDKRLRVVPAILSMVGHPTGGSMMIMMSSWINYARPASEWRRRPLRTHCATRPQAFGKAVAAAFSSTVGSPDLRSKSCVGSIGSEFAAAFAPDLHDKKARSFQAYFLVRLDLCTWHGAPGITRVPAHVALRAFE
jgi:hypothetical protein